MDFKDCLMKKKISRLHLRFLSQKPVCLVAGGVGFIGSYLCEELLSHGCQVICIDNLLTGEKENIADCLTNPDFAFIKNDLTKPLEEDLPKIDYLFHLAGVEAYIDNENISLETLLVNASGTINLLELARKDNAKFLLGSSIDVYSGVLSASSLKDLFGKKEWAYELFSHHEAKRFAESLVSEYSKRYKLDARIVRLGQVYGPKMNKDAGTGIASLIRGALTAGPLKVPGDGLTSIHPSFVSDIIDGILRAMFVSDTCGRIFSLVDPREVTLLSFANEICKLSPLSLSIEFVPERGEEKFPIKQETLLITQRALGWKPKVEASVGIRKTLDYFLKEKKDKKSPIHLTSPIETNKKLGKKFRLPRFHLPGQLRTVLIVFFLILIFLFYPFFTLSFNSLWGINRLRQAKGALVLDQFDRAATYSSSAQKSFNRARESLDQLDWVFRIRGSRSARTQAEGLLGIGQNLAGAISHASLAAQAGVEIGAVVFQNQEGEIGKLTFQIKSELDLVYEQLSLIEADLKSNPNRLLVGETFGLKEGEELVNKLPQMRELILEIKNAVVILPELIALPGKRTYLVLLQNNMELRPTGGFIGSFALITFENGRFIDFEVHNIYTADGQLKGHVEPPAEIKKYLGEAGWYLRDSNWDPDFPTSAIRAEWFLEKEMDRSVDGVLTVDLFFAQKLLEVVGEINLPDYQEKITAKNLFERAQYQAEIGFFPGSTQKEDFLGALSRALFEQVRTAPQEEWFRLSYAIYSALSEKDMLVYLHNRKAAEVISHLGWDGGIGSVRCEEEEKGCLADYLMIVEANFGVNKANFFIKRSLSHQVKIADDGAIKEVLQIVYQNESSTQNYLAGRYKDYLRIYTPEGTQLSEIKIDGEALGAEKINTSKISGKTAFGFLVEVPIKEEKRVEVIYQLAQKLNLTNPKIRYLLLAQRQPGSSKDALNLWLTYPADIALLKTAPQASLASQTAFFKPELSKDLFFQVDFAR